MTADAVDRAQLLQAAGDVDEARRVLEAHLADAPSDGRALVQLAQLLAMRGDRLGAEEAARRALADTPVRAWAEAALARVTGLDPQRAVESHAWARAAVATEPRSSDLRLLLAVRAAEVGSTEEAIHEVDAALRLGPADPLARSAVHATAARALLVAPGATAEAEAHARRALDLDPSNALAAHALHVAERTLRQQQQPQRAGDIGDVTAARRNVIDTGLGELRAGEPASALQDLATRAVLSRVLTIMVLFAAAGSLVGAIVQASTGSDRIGATIAASLVLVSLGGGAFAFAWAVRRSVTVALRRLATKATPLIAGALLILAAAIAIWAGLINGSAWAGAAASASVLAASLLVGFGMRPLARAVLGGASV